jgi:cytochrome c-type biogenesis protein
VTRGLYLMAVYSLGLGLPFLLSALFITRAIGLMKRLRPHMRKIEVAMGLLLVAVGMLLFTSSFSMVSGWMLDMMDGASASRCWADRGTEFSTKTRRIFVENPGCPCP